ncbi:MAG: PhzF family phenazine biosynthesis protein [Candidatus Thermoplasmatota archaeon]|nr:PhzF family phenazine biosynthesis protein [Candidatus Thermoplasmatota archaeon]
MNDYLKQSDAKFVCVITHETDSEGALLRARTIYIGGEDPATGSAAGLGTAWLQNKGLIESEKQCFVEHRSKINRTSRIYIRGTRYRTETQTYGGKCLIISKGELTT